MRRAGCSSCCSGLAGGWLAAAGAGRQVEEQQRRQQRLAASAQQQLLACSCRMSSGMWRVEVTATVWCAALEEPDRVSSRALCHSRRAWSDRHVTRYDNSLVFLVSMRMPRARAVQSWQVYYNLGELPAETSLADFRGTKAGSAKLQLAWNVRKARSVTWLLRLQAVSVQLQRPVSQL